jgi:phospholipid-binding lipoprotein MlaA
MAPGLTRTTAARMCRAAAAALALAGCATPAPEGQLIGDPYESLNRDIHEFNVGVDVVLLRPAAFVYKEATPALGQHLISNALDHLSLPVIFANNLLQGDADAALDTFGRFVANTAFGLGVLDPATEMGLPLRPTDFGLTLASWGAAEGPYVVLPFFGPSTGRDAPGLAVDFALDPLTYVGLPGGTATSVALAAGSPITTRAENFALFDQLLFDSEDSYVTLRNVYVQTRRRAAAGGVTPDESLPDIFSE